MNITLLVNTDPPNKITKNPTDPVALAGNLVEGTSISDPDIRIEYNGYPPGNYAYIPEFGRYYYIKDVTSENTGLWRLHLHVDPLKSFASQILANKAVIARSADTFNLYLEDSRYKAYADPIVVTRVFPNGFNTFQYVLAMLGGHD
jgi:hypothetical protein